MMMLSNCGWFHVKQENLQRRAKAQENVSVLTFPSLEYSGIPGRWIHYSQCRKESKTMRGKREQMEECSIYSISVFVCRWWCPATPVPRVDLPLRLYLQLYSAHSSPEQQHALYEKGPCILHLQKLFAFTNSSMSIKHTTGSFPEKQWRKLFN